MKRTAVLLNHFWVLGVAPNATRMEIERAGQKLLAQLAIGAASATSYSTPLGPKPRDEAQVRSALAALRDPEKRVFEELWADAVADAPPALPAFRGALRRMGFSPR